MDSNLQSEEVGEGQDIFYGRVSKHQQNLDLQMDTAKRMNCKYIFMEKISGAAKDRPEYQRMMDFVRAGDRIVVWKLDRLGRNFRELLKTMWALSDKGLWIYSVTDGIDTKTEMGQTFFIMGAKFAETERNYTIERTNAGLAAARARGRYGGRPCKFDTEKYRLFDEKAKENRLNNKRIAEIVGMSPSSYYRYKKKIESGELVLT